MNKTQNTIPKGWKITTLGGVGVVITGKTPSKNNPEDWGDFLDFITPTDFVLDLKYLGNVGRRLSEIGAKRFQKMIIPNGSIIVTCIGSDMGKVVINKNDALTNQQINSIKVDVDNSVDYIYYLLKNSYIVLRNIAVGGSTMPILNKSTFESLEFFVPPLPEQRAIARVLSSFDDKIELLREQNKTLEATAQAIFKEWFVKFNFPVEVNSEKRKVKSLGYKDGGGKMVDSELGEIPEGWRAGKYSDLAEVVTGKGIKKEDLENNGLYQVLGANGEIGKTNEYLFDEDLILTGRVGTLGTIYFSKGKVWISDNVLISKPKLSQYFYFAYFCLKRLNFDSLNRGSTQPLITQTDLKNVEIILPTEQIMKKWHNLSSGLFSKVFNNNFQIQTLSKLRDALLSKLMSGEVRVEGF